jgi:hypothetical protein
MRPDLFAGPALRDDRHRILARLANGGSVPAPARQWLRWEPRQRARLAAVATLLATGAAAWVWLQNDAPAHDLPPESAMHATPQAMPQAPAALLAAPQQAATIVNVVQPQSEPAPALELRATAGAGPGQAAARPADSKPLHPRPAKVAGTSRRQQSPATAPESDEDVTLLAAMLKHAKPQKPLPTQPKD